MKLHLKTEPSYLYYYLLILLLANNWLGDSRVLQKVYSLAKPIVLASVIFIIVVLLFKKKYQYLELLLIFTLISLGLYTSNLTDSKWPLYSMILIAFARDIDIETTIFIIYRCMCIFISISVGIFLIQYFFMPNTLDIFEDMSSGVIKYSMTFIGANEAARYWIYWFTLFMYVNDKKRINILQAFIILLMTVLFFLCTHSDALLLIPAITLLRCLGQKKCLKKHLLKCGGYSFGILWMFSLIILLFENSYLFNFMDRFFTGRLILGIHGMNEHGISFLGQANLEFGYWILLDGIKSIRIIVDNAYYMIMIKYGTFYLILITFLFIKACKRLDIKSSCCLIMYSVFALAENTILSPTAIFPVIIAANLCWSKKKESFVLYGCLKSTK